MGAGGQAVTGLVVCHHSHVVDVTAPQAVQEAAGAAGVAADRGSLVRHSLDRVGAGASGRAPHHLSTAHVVVQRHIHRDTGLCRGR